MNSAMDYIRDNRWEFLTLVIIFIFGCVIYWAV